MQRVPSDPMQKRQRMRELRVNAYETFKKPVFPVSHTARFVIPETGYVPPREVTLALKELSEDFEIIHDPLTCAPGDPPELGCHLYTVFPGFFGNGIDMIVLEFSLQEVIGERWPNGKPKAPGMWVVDAARERMKSRLDGDKASINKGICKGMVDANVKAREESDKKLEEASREVSNVFKEVGKGRVVVGVDGLKGR